MHSTINEINETELDEIALPYGHTVKLKEIEYANGMRILRATIRENRRFTTLDFDPERASELATALMNWSRKVTSADTDNLGPDPSGLNLTFESDLLLISLTNVRFIKSTRINMLLVVLLIKTFANGVSARECKCLNRTTSV